MFYNKAKRPGIPAAFRFYAILLLYPLFRFRDGNGSIMGKHRLECEMTFRAGEIVWDFNARAFPQSYDELPSDYGIKLPDVRVTPKN